MTEKTCNTCGHGNRLYRKFYISYYKDKEIICGLSDTICGKDCSCEKWQKKGKDYDLSKRRFDEAEQDIKIIFKLLEN